MKNETHPNKKNMTDTNEMRLATMRRALADRPMLDSLRPEDRELLITGSTIQVMFDHDAGTSKRIPAAVRARFEAFDGPFGTAARKQGT